MLRARNGVCRDVSVQLSVCVVAVASVCFQSLEVWLCYGPSSVAVCDHGRVASWATEDECGAAGRVRVSNGYRELDEGVPGPPLPLHEPIFPDQVFAVAFKLAVDELVEALGMGGEARSPRQLPPFYSHHPLIHSQARQPRHPGPVAVQ